MPPGLDNLKHIVVLMMENRSFDHMLGSLTAVNPLIEGITAALSNPDTTGALVQPQALAEFQGQLDPDPDHHFPAVDLQIFGGDTSSTRVANMQGFVKNYFNQQQDVGHSQKIMYYFAQKQLPVLTTLALEFAVFNRWFASIPGPTICNRAFAHYGTSFGRVDMDLLYVNEPFQ
ncbi:MAG: alkaline phosphatase family protein, partial [Candidatus Sulfotelmatobacter sp.]